jgi:hypothetical protein
MVSRLDAGDQTQNFQMQQHPEFTLRTESQTANATHEKTIDINHGHMQLHYCNGTLQPSQYKYTLEWV